MRARRRPPPAALSARPARLTGGGIPHCTPRTLPAASRARRPTQSGSRPRRAHQRRDLGFRGRFLSRPLHATSTGQQKKVLPSRTATPAAHAPSRLHALAPRRRIQLQVIIHVGDHSADPPRPNLSSPACPQPHAVVPHYKQSNTFPMSLEDYKQKIHLSVFYLRSGLVFAALAVCHYCTQLYVSASILLCRSAAISHFAVQSHTEPVCPQPHAVVPHYKQSNTFPMSLEDYKQKIHLSVFYLRSGLVFAALAVCHYCTQLYVSASILLCRSAAISHFAVQSHTDPMVVRGDDKLCAKQHLPYVPGGLSKKTNTVYCILPPFWVGACLVRHKLSLCITNLCPRRRPIACPRRIASLPQRCFCSICVLLL